MSSEKESPANHVVNENNLIFVLFNELMWMLKINRETPNVYTDNTKLVSKVLTRYFQCRQLSNSICEQGGQFKLPNGSESARKGITPRKLIGL